MAKSAESKWVKLAHIHTHNDTPILMFTDAKSKILVLADNSILKNEIKFVTTTLYHHNHSTCACAQSTNNQEL